MPPNATALFWSTMVRVCPPRGGGFSPVVAWAVHVSVGKEIQRVTIASGGREREEINMLQAGMHVALT